MYMYSTTVSKLRKAIVLCPRRAKCFVNQNRKEKHCGTAKRQTKHKLTYLHSISMAIKSAKKINYSMNTRWSFATYHIGPSKNHRQSLVAQMQIVRGILSVDVATMEFRKQKRWMRNCSAQQAHQKAYIPKLVNHIAPVKNLPKASHRLRHEI